MVNLKPVTQRYKVSFEIRSKSVTKGLRRVAFSIKYGITENVKSRIKKQKILTKMNFDFFNVDGISKILDVLSKQVLDDKTA